VCLYNFISFVSVEMLMETIIKTGILIAVN
jgi:hypothetical protein